MALSIVCVVVASCFVVERGAVREHEPAAAPTRVASAMKVFLHDGSIAVFPDGGRISDDSIYGTGRRYSVGLMDSIAVTALPLDSVIGIEAFQGGIDPVLTLAASAAVTGLSVVGAMGLISVVELLGFVASFGSCPTFYASPEQGGTLQSEAFAYSIAPLFEGRDLDALYLRPDSDGVIRLELRNEALETHYINHLELVTVEHDPGARVIPDERAQPIALSGGSPPVAAIDGDGRSVVRELSAWDGHAYSSTDTRILQTTSIEDRESVELTFEHPGGKEAVLELRLRNSLLSTVLLYDLMLAEAGAEAIDWLAEDLTRIGRVIELGAWFQQGMSLRVEVHEGGQWVAAGRVPDTGPIAWETVGVRIDLPEAETVRVRLSFFTDSWRIDGVSLGAPAELRSVERLPVARVAAGDDAEGSRIRSRLAEPDDDYLVTYPGASVWLEFEPPAPSADNASSYILSSQGYYTEWIRPGWIRQAATERRFRPEEDTIERLMALWTEKKDAFEEAFFNSRVPAR